MSPPNGVKPVGSGGVSPSVDPKEERKSYLQTSEFFLDPSNASDPAHLQKKWTEDREFRVKNYKLIGVMDLFTRFMNRDSEVTPQKMKAAIEDWTASPEFKTDPVNEVVLRNMHRILGRFQDTENQKQAAKLRETLPPAPKPVETKKDESKDAPKGDAKDPNAPIIIDPKQTLAVGLEFQNDTGMLALFDVAGVPISALASEKSHFTLKPTVDFPMGKWVGMVRLNGGMFEARGIPGDDFKPGDGYRIGLDFGLVNPYSRSHDRAGLGIELTGVANHAGQKSGIEAPGPLVRLHLFRESDINIPIADRFELGFSSFFNHQETYITLGNNPNLLATPGGAETNPLATASSMFARSPLRWFGVSGRYYINGIPEREKREDLSKPFRPGEGVAKVGHLWTGQMINFNRREDIPPFANTQVFFGTFWPLGIPASQQQFDTVSTGLLLYSLQDGFFMARNAQLRGEIWRRDDSWILRGLMLGGDALLLGANIYRAATAKADPPVNQTIEEFVKDPGSVTDFSGRAGKLNLKLFPAEFALSALDASGIAGNISDPDLTRYYATSGVAAGLGLLGVLFSSPLSGGSCGDYGSLFRCSFHGRKGEYFKSGIDAGPQNMTDIENEYVMSASSAALASWGVTRLLQPLFIPDADSDKKATSGKKKKSTAMIEDINFNVGINPGGGSIQVGGRF